MKTYGDLKLFMRGHNLTLKLTRDGKSRRWVAKFSGPKVPVTGTGVSAMEAVENAVSAYRKRLVRRHGQYHS